MDLILKIIVGTILVLMTLLFIYLVGLLGFLFCRGIYNLIKDVLLARRNNKIRVTVELEGLGRFSSLDKKRWSGRAVYGRYDVVYLYIDTDGEPPNQRHIAHLQEILNQLDHSSELGIEYIRQDENGPWPRDEDAYFDDPDDDPEEYVNGKWRGGDRDRFEASRVSITGDHSEFSIAFSHGVDPHADYEVAFHDGIPVDGPHRV